MINNSWTTNIDAIVCDIARHHLQTVFGVLGTDLQGTVAVNDLLRYFRAAPAKVSLVLTQSPGAPMTVELAKELIKAKVFNKFGDNTTGCGKAFLCFDVEGEGLISHGNFEDGLRRYTGLQVFRRQTQFLLAFRTPRAAGSPP